MIKYIAITILLIASTAFCAWTISGDLTITPKTRTPNAMFFGDSITAGAGAAQTVQAYRKALAGLVDYVHRGSFEAIAPYKHDGVSGEATSVIEARVFNALKNISREYRHSGNIVLIHAGTNDVRDCAGTSCVGGELADAVTNVEDMIDLIQADNPDTAIYVALIIPCSEVNGCTSAENGFIDTFNGLLSTMIGGQSGEVYEVDMNTAFKNVSGWDNGLLSQQVHPNEDGYIVMAQTWATAILANE